MELDQEQILSRFNKKRISERGDLIGQITDKLNKDRKPPYKLLTYSRIAIMLSAMPIKDLYWLISMEKECNNWSKWFWWKMKH